ncbi:MAG: hypothetical protein JSU97_05105 [Dehalococcoidia bacterium]|nr:MAG: hypothetical protein JSU97_05105 [Dehalococcoidia bacterium]
MQGIHIQFLLLGLQADTWQAIEAIAVSVGVGVAIVGLAALGVAVYQLREERKARQLEALTSIMEQLTAVAGVETGLWLETLDAESVAKLAGSDREKALSIVYAYNRAGFLLDQGFISAKPILKLFGQGALRYWERLLPFIRQRRNEPGHEREGLHYQRLCDRVRAWMDSADFRNELREARKVLGHDERDQQQPEDKRKE